LGRAGGDDLVEVHVRGRATAAYDQGGWELVGMVSSRDLLARVDDGGGSGLVQDAQRVVRDRGGLFDLGVGMD